MSLEPPQPVRKRKLNVSAIKLTIVFFAGMAIAVGSALTGLAPQTALAPSLTWMLGFTPEKALGSAMRYATYVLLAVIVGVFVGHGIAAVAIGKGVVAFIGATLGALLALPLAPQAANRRLKQLFLTVGIGLTLFVVQDAARISLYHVHLSEPVSLLACLGIGLAVGALTQFTSLPGGLLMVIALYYVGRFGAVQAISTSLIVIMLAAVLPALGYAKRGQVDQEYNGAAITGGILGGFGGGLVMAHADQKVLMLTFGVMAMYLCARELYRLIILNPGDPPTASPQN